MLVLLKNHRNYLKSNIFECFFKMYNIIKKKNVVTYNDEKSKV